MGPDTPFGAVSGITCHAHSGWRLRPRVAISVTGE
jgi:hypothetical protein